jgi:hypothetical protein
MRVPLRRFAALAGVAVAFVATAGEAAGAARPERGASTRRSASPPVTVTLPPVTLPAVTLPPVTLPPVTLPPVTLPPVSLPPVTAPPVTLPPTTVPGATPPTTVPGATLPGGTGPSVTVPAGGPTGPVPAGATELSESGTDSASRAGREPGAVGAGGAATARAGAGRMPRPGAAADRVAEHASSPVAEAVRHRTLPAALAASATSFVPVGALMALIVAFLFAEAAFDRRDPKLARAPIDRDDETLPFS